MLFVPVLSYAKDASEATESLYAMKATSIEGKEVALSQI